MDGNLLMRTANCRFASRNWRICGRISLLTECWCYVRELISVLVQYPHCLHARLRTGLGERKQLFSRPEITESEYIQETLQRNCWNHKTLWYRAQFHYLLRPLDIHSNMVKIWRSWWQLNARSTIPHKGQLLELVMLSERVSMVWYVIQMPWRLSRKGKLSREVVNNNENEFRNYFIYKLFKEMQTVNCESWKRFRGETYAF